jgi:transcriptional regulator with XRE-family HTH domain
MSDQPPNVGERVRIFREQRGLSMRGLAKMCDLSPNAISLMERGVTSPNVSSLHRLSRALQVPIHAFFDEPQESANLVVTRAGERPSSTHGQAQLLNLGSGLEDQVMEPFEVLLPPGASSGQQEISHTGQELVYCLEGQLEYKVDGRSYLLHPGDTLVFDAWLPHCWGNPGDTTTRFIMVFGACQDHDSLVKHLQA